MSLPKYDWQSAEAFYLQGQSFQQISAKLGMPVMALRQRRYLKRWTRANAHRITVAENRRKALESNEARERISRILEAQITALEDQLPVKYRQLRPPPAGIDFAAMSRSVLEQARAVYGWDQDKRQPAPLNLTQINIGPAQPGQSVQTLAAPGSTDPDPDQT